MIIWHWVRSIYILSYLTIHPPPFLGEDHSTSANQRDIRGSRIERTFLAWLRTSLAFASIGVAITQLFRLQTSLPDSGSVINQDTLRHIGRPLGAAFLVISIIILLLGYRRYTQGQKWIILGKFPASRGTIIVVSLVALAIMILSLVVVIVIHPSED